MVVAPAVPAVERLINIPTVSKGEKFLTYSETNIHTTAAAAAAAFEGEIAS